MKNFLLLAAVGLMAAVNGVAQNNESAILNKNGTMEYQLATKADATEYWVDHAASSYAGGSGTEADPYLIETPEQLAKLVVDATGNGEWVNLLEGVYFKQIADIDLSSRPCNRLGIGLNGYFSGVYDGNGYAIKGYNTNNVSTESREGLGLMFCIFANLRDATVKNVNIEDYSLDINYSNIRNSTLATGMLVAYASNTKIENCTAEGEIKSSFSGRGISGLIGGIVAFSYDNTIINDCVTKGTITNNLEAGSDNLADAKRNYLSGGGIIAEAENTKIINCTNKMNINNVAKGNAELGIVARSAGIITYSNNVQILNCSNQGTMKASSTNSNPANWSQAAGIGTCITNSTVDNCWNTADIYAENAMEGEDPRPIICWWDNTSITHCYYNREAENAVGSGSDKGLAVSYMQSEAFVNDLNANLPEGGIEWKYQESDYPTLQAEESTPDANEQIQVANTTFRLTQGAVEISTEQPTDITIYTMQGIQKVARRILAGTASIALEPGLYILQLNGKGHKIVIR